MCILFLIAANIVNMDSTSPPQEWELSVPVPAKPGDSDYGYVAKGHLGGLVGGLLLGWLGFRRNERWITRHEKLIEFGGAAALVALLLTAGFTVYRLVT